MDKIQKVLVKAGRKDLAQLYYKKIVSMKQSKVENQTFDWKEQEDALKWIRKRIKTKDVYHYDDGSDAYLLFSLSKGSKTDEIEKLFGKGFNKKDLYKLSVDDLDKLLSVDDLDSL